MHDLNGMEQISDWMHSKLTLNKIYRLLCAPLLDTCCILGYVNKSSDLSIRKFPMFPVCNRFAVWSVKTSEQRLGGGESILKTSCQFSPPPPLSSFRHFWDLVSHPAFSHNNIRLSQPGQMWNASDGFSRSWNYPIWDSWHWGAEP